MEQVRGRAGAGFGGLPAFALLAGAILAAAPARAGETATLTIHVQNLSARGGVLRLGLYDAAGYADDKAAPVAAADVTAQAPETVVTLKDVPPGIYAIETFQDVNANGRMDTDWLGLPLEPYGFSRNARPHFAKPGFAAVQFAVTPGENGIALRLETGLKLLAEK